MAGYRELIFYQKAREVVKGINALIKQWPRSMQAQEIGQQLFRAATSVGANIAEGHGRHQGREYVHYLIISQGSANEVDHWLNTAFDCNLGDETKIQKLIALNTEVTKMLAGTIRTRKSRQTKRSTREDSPPYSPAPSPFSPLEESND